MDSHIPKLIFPINIGPSFTIKKLTWNDFPGKPNPLMPWSAHIYWDIEYIFKTKKRRKQPEIKIEVTILPQSWVKKQLMSDALLAHENGHYLIGCLCALDFIKKVNTSRSPLSYNYAQYAKILYNLTLDQYLKLQKRYDEETQHRLNLQKQQQWNKFLHQKIMSYVEEQSQKKIVIKNEKKFILKKKIPRIKYN